MDYQLTRLLYRRADTIFCRQMGGKRHKGIGMNKAKKKKSLATEVISEGEESDPEPEPEPEPDPEPYPELEPEAPVGGYFSVPPGTVWIPCFLSRLVGSPVWDLGPGLVGCRLLGILAFGLLGHLRFLWTR